MKVRDGTTRQTVLVPCPRPCDERARVPKKGCNGKEKRSNRESAPQDTSALRDRGCFEVRDSGSWPGGKLVDGYDGKKETGLIPPRGFVVDEWPD
jgi:hypothetical protein